MSYDIYLQDAEYDAHVRAHGCPPWDSPEADTHRCPGDYIWAGNITYNIGPMWADALRVDEHVPATAAGAISAIMGFTGDRAPYGIHRFEGAPGVEAAGPLLQAVSRMEADPDRYRVMEPDNGWGNYEGALQYLRDLAHLCSEYPSYRIHVS